MSLLKTFRNNLSPEHRLTRMLLSGTGEIFMVMVGVLLALLVQNWNDDRKNAIKEAKLLREMHTNLASDLSDCRYNIEVSARYLRGNQAVLKQLTDRTPFHDSLRIHYANIWGNTTLTTNLAAYDNLKSIGFNLVRNDSLRQLITALYSNKYRYLHDVEFEADSKLQWELMMPLVNAHVVVDTIWVSGHPIDAEALMDNVPFQGYLRTNIFIRKFMMRQYKSIEKRIEDLQAMIHRELEGR